MTRDQQRLQLVKQVEEARRRRDELDGKARDAWRRAESAHVALQGAETRLALHDAATS